MKMLRAIVPWSILALAGSAFAQQYQQRRFDWLPANQETVRLDPANYHAGRTYHPGPDGGSIHVDITAQRPVTIFMVPAAEWDAALERPEMIGNLRPICASEHVTQTTYTCSVPPDAVTLIVRDERSSLDPVVFAGLGAVLNPDSKGDRAISTGVAAMLAGQGLVTRRFTSPNDVHIQYYRWVCIENCVQPEFQWIREVKEKYDLTSFLKVYGGYVPQYDGEQVSVRIKSPVPMVVAILPSNIADQLYGNPQLLESALAKNSCQQRGVQSLQFQCTLSAADGPQSLVVAPEPGSRVPHKKAEVEWLANRCVANCSAPPRQ